MPEYLAPGVYLEEIATGAKPIEGVGTSTAGFVGETARGPVRPTLVRSWTEFVRRYGEFVEGNAGATTSPSLPYAVRGCFENGASRLVIARVAGRTATTAALAVAAPSGSLELRAIGPGSWGNDVHVTVRPSSDGGLFALDIEYAGRLETFERLSTVHSRPDFAITAVNPASELVEILACPESAPDPVTRTALTGGTDAPALLEDYVGGTASPWATGLDALAGIKGISIMAAPADVSIEGLAAAVIDVCESRRDRFAITAAPDAGRQAALIRPIRDTSWGATYHPWLRVEASHLPGGAAIVPPHGHVCGIYARVDRLQGVHRPPANEEVRGILGPSHRMTQADQEVLNPRGISVIRDFRPQRGVLLWGARTMSSDGEWKYINVRRLFIFLERSIERGLQWAVFEPNTEPTWMEVRRVIEDFLTRQWRGGALAGDRVEHAFYVRCDRSTMSRADIDEGRLVVEIGVAVIRPAEFLIIRISVRTAPDDRP